MKERDLYENMLAAMLPGGIEAQEAHGQRIFVQSETMPKDGGMGIDSRPLLEQINIKVLGDYDDIFYSVELPAGWHKEPTEHPMWNKLIDDKGRERASIFYKAAFYDRNAHMRLKGRFRAGFEVVGGWENYRFNNPNTRYFGAVYDDNKIIWRSDESDDNEIVTKLAIAKVAEMYPDYKNTAAYWD